MKKVISLFLLISSSIAWAIDTFNSADGQLIIPSVQVGSTLYTNVVVQLSQSDMLSVVVAGGTITGTVDGYANGILKIPSVQVGANKYSNVSVNVALADVISVGGSSSITLTLPNGNPSQYGVHSSNYSSASGNYTTSKSVVFGFTTLTPLAANLSNADISSVISTVNFDDGLFSGTLDNSAFLSSGGGTVIASIDNTGNLTSLQLTLLSPQAPHYAGESINSLQLTYASGTLTVIAKNNALCSAVGSNGSCSSFAPAQSLASSSSSQTFSVNTYPSYSQLFVFSDSFSDTGRRLLLEGIPGSPYWNGRHSNGPVSIEYMASN